MLFVSPFDGSDEAVAKFRHRLDEMGNLSRISENFAQTIDDGIETGVEIHKGVGRPYGAAEFFAGDQVAGPFEEFEQHYEKLLLDFDADTAFTQFVCAGIKLKCAKAVHGRTCILLLLLFRFS